jgi:hypothetical protein
MAQLADQLSRLATMSSAELRSEWLALYKRPAPDMTADLLRRGLAYRLQERAAGGLTPATLREIERLDRHRLRTGEAVPLPATRIKPGTRLVRDWGGRTHHVVVLDTGFLYDDRRFRSLSTIAGEITGAKWSGPRFFGLKAKVAADA